MSWKKEYNILKIANDLPKHHHMNNEQILEGNKIIAEFMGITVTDFHWRALKSLVYCVEDGDIDYRYLEYYQPDSDWNKLMPVVEKISKIPLIGATEIHDVCYPVTFGMPHTDGTIMVRFSGSFINYGETLIEATWLAVVEFIQAIDSTKL